jgi:hypothetical protein
MTNIIDNYAIGSKDGINLKYIRPFEFGISSLMGRIVII